MTTRFASPTEAHRAAALWPTSYLLCRTQGHPWGDPQTRFNKRYAYYSQACPCPRCGSVLRLEMNKNGHVLARWIDYPEGFLSDIGRIAGDAKDALRISAITRSTVTTTTELPRSMSAKRLGAR